MVACAFLQLLAVLTHDAPGRGARAGNGAGTGDDVRPNQSADGGPIRYFEAGPHVRAVRSPAGVVVPVVGGSGGDWHVSTPCGREAVLSVAAPVRSVAVVLDPGHGGVDWGAVGPNGLAESELNLAVARHAKAALERAGFSTVLTRSSDHGMNLANRARLAVDLGARAFVSIHHNGGAELASAKPGSETYYQVESVDSRRLAGLVYEEVVSTLSAYPVGWVTTERAGATWRTRVDGQDYFGVLRQSNGVPASLAELAYLTNPPEAELLADPTVQRAEGEAVARGIVRFLTTNDRGSGYVEGWPMPPRPQPGGEDLCDDPQL